MIGGGVGGKVRITGSLIVTSRRHSGGTIAGWTAAVRKCLEDAGERLPKHADRGQLAQFVLTVMEGGVMQSRTFRNIGHFDRAVAQLREHFEAVSARASA